MPPVCLFVCLFVCFLGCLFAFWGCSFFFCFFCSDSYIVFLWACFLQLYVWPSQTSPGTGLSVMATSVRVLGSFSSGFDWDLHRLRLCICVYTVTHLHTNIQMFRYTDVALAFKLCIVVSTCSQVGSQNTWTSRVLPTNRASSVDWQSLGGRGPHVLAEAQMDQSSPLLGMVWLWSSERGAFGTQCCWHEVVVKFQNCCMEVILLKVGKPLIPSTYFGVWWTTRVWLQYFQIFSRWGSGKSCSVYFFGKECEKGRI